MAAVRDRTNLFLSYRQSYPDHPSQVSRFRKSGALGSAEERQGLIAESGDGDAVIEMDSLRPQWALVQEEVEADLRDISKLLPNVEALFRQHLLPEFKDDKIKLAERRRIDGETRRVASLLKSAQARLESVDQMIAGRGPFSGRMTRIEAKMAENMKLHLAGLVLEASTSFRKKQSSYLKKLERFGDLQESPRVRQSYSEWDSSYTGDSGGAQLQEQSQNIKGRRRNPALDIKALTAKEAEVQEIARSVEEISTLMRDLLNLIVEQGTVIDRIDHHIQEAKERIVASKAELTTAAHYANQSTKRVVMLLLVVIIIGVGILLSLKVSRDSPAPAPAPAPPVIEAPTPGEDPWAGFRIPLPPSDRRWHFG